MYNCEMCNTSFETKEEFLAHPHIVQKKVEEGWKQCRLGSTPDFHESLEQSMAKNGELFKRLAKPDIGGIQPDGEVYTFDEPFMFEEEPVILLPLQDAAEQALWDLRQWVEDHPEDCECFTCGDSIPDLERALNPPAQFHGICC